MTLDPATVEALIGEITQAIIEHGGGALDLSAEETVCADCRGQCAQECPDRTRAIVRAGASRISAGPGAAGIAGNLARYIDHTLLKPEATSEQIAKLCQEAVKYHFASVCVNPTYALLAAQQLRGSSVKVCTVVGFPLGAHTTAVKAYEAQQAVGDGAAELDMVMNIGALKSGDEALVEADIAAVAQVAHGSGAICKVILETALLSDEEKVKACRLAKQAGADFVKTSTGFGGGGATAHDVALMRQTVGPGVGVKAAGGIKTVADAQAMLAAGATRIGASAGVQIVREAEE